VQVDGKIEAIAKEDPMEVSRAIELIRKCPDQTVAHPLIDEAIQKRIGKYPEKMLEKFHHSNLLLPPKVAMLLKSKPSLVSAAVRSFHEKDSIDLKVSSAAELQQRGRLLLIHQYTFFQTAKLMPHFSPIEQLTKARVRFTKTLYAMLSSEDFYPDFKSKWKFPLSGSPEFKGNSLGAKLVNENSEILKLKK
jgi:hypothetical protein